VQNRAKGEPAFTSTGFTNWKKAKKRFQDHAKSSSHADALAMWHEWKKDHPVCDMINEEIERQHNFHKEKVRKSFV